MRELPRLRQYVKAELENKLLIRSGVFPDGDRKLNALEIEEICR